MASNVYTPAIKKTIPKIEGEATKHTNSIYLSWEHPDTGEEQWAQGEFETNKEKTEIYHTVFDIDDNIQYIVVAKI
jgi:hypothetical protein